MLSNFFTLFVSFVGFCWVAGYSAPNKFPESPGLPPLSNQGFFADLQVGDTREVVLQKLQGYGFLGYTELQSNLIKSPVRWDGHAYELTCKFQNEGLLLCLIQGEAGWQEFFYDDIVKPQWQSLRNRVTEAYGKPNLRVNFPMYHEVPLNDEGGLITDQWDLVDRLILLCLHTYTQQDCCTRQVLDFSCCTLLIKPK